MPEAWLTYAEAGDRFGLSADALRMRARRLGWRIQPGNDGRARVLVPDDAAIEPRPRSAEGSPERSGEGSPEQSDAFGRLLDLLEAADGHVDRAEQRAEQAEQRANLAEIRAETAEADRRAADARAERAEQALIGERQRADALRDRLDAADAGQRAALRAADELRQAEAARRAQRLLARLRDAWRGR